MGRPPFSTSLAAHSATLPNTICPHDRSGAVLRNPRLPNILHSNQPVLTVPGRPPFSTGRRRRLYGEYPVSPRCVPNVGRPTLGTHRILTGYSPDTHRGYPRSNGQALYCNVLIRRRLRLKRNCPSLPRFRQPHRAKALAAAKAPGWSHLTLHWPPSGLDFSPTFSP